MKTCRSKLKIDKLKHRYTKRKPRLKMDDDDDELDSHFYYDIEDIIHQSGAGYSIKKYESSTTHKTKQLLNKLINLGWRPEYVQKTFQNMNDKLIQNWSDNLLIESIFKHIIQQSGYHGSIKKSFMIIGLYEDVADKLEYILIPLLDSSYSYTQILDKGIEYLLGKYAPIAPPNATHYIKLDKINTWFKYRGADSKPIQVYNIPYSVNDGLEQFNIALNTLPNRISPNSSYYFHTTSWDGSLSIMKRIDHHRGRQCLDFGINPGFYLANNHLNNIDWGIKNMNCWGNEVAILIFEIPDIKPSHIIYKELKGKEWILTTQKARECEQKEEIELIADYDLLYGDMVSNPNNVQFRKSLPKPHNPPKKQLVGKTINADRFLHKCLVGCVYFQKYGG